MITCLSHVRALAVRQVALVAVHADFTCKGYTAAGRGWTYAPLPHTSCRQACATAFANRPFTKAGSVSRGVAPHPPVCRAVCARRPASVSSRVVLPQPLGPMMACMQGRAAGVSGAVQVARCPGQCWGTGALATACAAHSGVTARPPRQPRRPHHHVIGLHVAADAFKNVAAAALDIRHRHLQAAAASGRGGWAGMRIGGIASCR